MKKKANLNILFIALVVVVAAYYFFSNSDTPAFSPNGDTLRVHFIDVGQGDSQFIELPNGECMLIDAGESNYGATVTSYISGLGYTHIDYLVASHPHADHIGGMRTVVNSFDIGEVYMPRVKHNTKTFENMLVAIDDKVGAVTTAKAGLKLELDDGLYAEFVAPVGEEHKDLNNWSAVVRLVYGDTSFLFTGDAEMDSEQQITSTVSADVLKVGHHGSSTSSGEEFLRRVAPAYAVISCGDGNSYGHPHRETVAALERRGIDILRTDLLGTIVIESDGGNVNVVDN